MVPASVPRVPFSCINDVYRSLLCANSKEWCLSPFRVWGSRISEKDIARRNTTHNYYKHMHRGWSGMNHHFLIDNGTRRVSERRKIEGLGEWILNQTHVRSQKTEKILQLRCGQLGLRG